MRGRESCFGFCTRHLLVDIWDVVHSRGNASLGVNMHIVKPDLVTGAAFVRDI